MHADYKVQGGKLIRIDASFDGGRITSIRITGDFFIHPEQAVESIERFLIGRRIGEGLAEELRSFLGRSGIRLVGMEAEDLTTALSMAQ